MGKPPKNAPMSATYPKLAPVAAPPALATTITIFDFFIGLFKHAVKIRLIGYIRLLPLFPGNNSYFIF